MTANHQSLPEDWSTMTLKDVALWGSGGTPKATNPAYYGGDVPWAVIGDLNDQVVTETAKAITNLGLEESSAKLVEPGAVLIAMYGASIGRMGIVGSRMATNQAIAFAYPDESRVLGKFLFFYLMSQKRQLTRAGKGAAQPNISQTILKAWPIPVPPLEEQRRIVEAIETHVSHLDAGVESLQRAKRQVELLWTAVLDRALETDDMGMLESFAGPSGITDGPFGSNLKTSHYTDSGPRVLRLQNIGRGVFVDDRAYISREHFESLRKHEAEAGDLLVASLYGDRLRSCVVPDDVGPAIVKADCIRIRPSETSDVRFLAYALQRPQVDQWCTERVRGVGRQRLGLKNIRSIPIPDFDPAAQHRVAREVASIESNLDHVTEEIEEAQSRAEGLRRAVLAAAFSGVLSRDQEVI